MRPKTWPHFELTVSILLEEPGINEMQAASNVHPVTLMIMVLAFLWRKSRQLPL